MRKISIIIPTLNEAQNIRNTILLLYRNATSLLDRDIVVVDGGSTDDTVKIAKATGVTVIKCPNLPRGRAHLLNEGVKHCEGQFLLFLDADSKVPCGYDSDIEGTLMNGENIGGAFDFKLDGKEFGLRIVELVNRTRYNIWSRYYGDQGLFVRREIFEKVGGFPEVPIMESSDLCVSLLKEGKLKLVRKPMLTSARRFLDGGIYRVLAFDFKAWWLNLLGHKTDSLAKSYWQFNETYSR